MKASLAAIMLGLSLSAVAAAPAPTAPLLPRMTDDAIHQAVREVLEANPESPRRHEADTIRGNRYQEFSQQFSEAKVPDCLHPDALKRQPARIGPISFQYLLAVPFVVVAKVRGKCL